MTRSELEAYILQKERDLGLQPGEFKAIWGQESGYSTDPNKSGIKLAKYQNPASGPFQVMPDIHPNFPVGGPLDKQADYALQYYASRGSTPAERAMGYYGRGKAPAGFPSTQQYAQQVEARRNGSQQATEQAPPQQEQTMQYQTEDPDALTQRIRDSYTPQYQERVKFEDPYASINYQPREMGFLEKWLSNPLTQGGIAMLAANSADPLANIGYGLQVAGHAYNQRGQADNELLDLQMKRAEAKAKARREAALENRDIDKSNAELYKQQQLLKYADSIEATKPQEAAMIRAGITSGIAAPTSFAPQIYTRDGKYYEVVMDNKGGRQEREVPAGMVPFNVESKTPQFQGQVSNEKAAGDVAGKARAQGIVDAPKEAMTAQQAIATIDEAIAHPGLKKAVGVGSYIPWTRGSEAADYGLIVDKIKGQAFLQAFQSLKGGGAITEIEGQKATQAITTLNTSQSEAAHRKALQDLRDIAAAAIERAQKKGAVVPNAGNQTPNTGNADQSGGWRIVR
jgi:hypothetical protein